MVGAAHAVFAGSDELAKDVVDAGGRACLVPTGVQVSSYVQRDNAMDSSVNRLQPCIGWIGNGNHYEGDLIDILLPALHDLAKICRFRLKLVGVAGSELLHAATSAITDFEVELVDQLDWSDPALIAGQLGTFDVGVYPLLDNPFNTRKCGFKALEYMATGIPVVASGNGANAQIVVHSETGYLASNKEDWVGYLSRLVADVNLRQSLGKAGRIRVESEFDVSRIARKISSILMEVGADA